MDNRENTGKRHALKTLVEKAAKVVIFTGAGISTESGIPDFRSPGGIWTKYQPIQFQDFMASEEMRRESWRRKFATDETLSKARPNVGHRAVAKWVADGRVTAVITQNVDGLHQAAGVPAEKVIEVHGNTTYAKCLDCAERYELDEIRAAFDDNERLLDCRKCGGIIKTATISFGQAMPIVEMQRAEEETAACDLLIAIGSSLVVYPAAGLPLLAKQQGAKLAILNREPTDHDAHADLVINDEIGPTLAYAAGVN